MKAIMAISKEQPPELQGNFSKNLKDIVHLCLNANPSKRPSADELLKHKFVKNTRRNYKELMDLVTRHLKWMEENQDQETDVK
jgi:serine/threonine-protein kinase 24/25/MST4